MVIKKIVLLSPKIKLGGVSSFVENILPFFVDPVNLFYRGKREKNESLIISIFSFFFYPLAYFIYLLKEKPDRIVINTSLSKYCLIRDGVFVLISKILRKKVLLIVHGFQEKALKHHFLLKYGYFKSDSIILLSKKYKNSFKEAGYQGKLSTQWNPVSKNLIEECKKLKCNFEKQINILFLSRIEKNKGIFTSLVAFNILQNKHSNLFFKIAGTGQSIEEAMKFVKENKIDNVEFLGYVKGYDKIQLLKECNIFLFPTQHNEGLPINVLEAMTAGQIIITRPVGGLVDLYEKCDFGFLISSTKAEDYANAIAEILKNKEKFLKISANNAKFAQENFHPKKITQNIECILRNL